ncbi:MAG: PQQ-binding-like beta-propeller repeat protein [Verrucomicrobiota bacterium]
MLALPLAALAADWPQFLGPTRNGLYSGTDVAGAWPKDGPLRVWQMTVGAGFSGPVAQTGKVILFHRLEDKEVVDCLKATDGARLWRFEYPTGYADDFGFDNGPRAAPTIAAGKVFTFGAEGTLHALDFETGRKIWSISVKDQLQAPKGFFGMACSPLFADGKVLLNVGGAEDAGIVAFEAGTGQLVWRATADEASYASPVAAMIEGKFRAIFFTRSGLVVLDPATGRIEFEFSWRARAHASVNAATPLVKDDSIFLSASYGTGAVLLQVKGKALEKVWSSDDALSSHYATPVERNGFLYGFHGRQEYGQSLRCLEWKTGKVRWSKEGFGAGSLILLGESVACPDGEWRTGVLGRFTGGLSRSGQSAAFG